MDIKIYSKKDKGRMKVVLTLDDDDNIIRTMVGNSAISHDKCIQFYLDDYVANQIDKFNIRLDGNVDPIFELKKGEELEVPSDADRKQKEIEKLERRLKELKGVDVGVR